MNNSWILCYFKVPSKLAIFSYRILHEVYSIRECRQPQCSTHQKHLRGCGSCPPIAGRQSPYNITLLVWGPLQHEGESDQEAVLAHAVSRLGRVPIDFDVSHFMEQAGYEGHGEVLSELLLGNKQTSAMLHRTTFVRWCGEVPQLNIWSWIRIGERFESASLQGYTRTHFFWAS